MQVRAPVVACTLLCLAAAAGCPKDPRELAPPEVVATVDDAEIRRTSLVAELSRSGVARLDGDERREALARRVLDRMVRQELLFRAATDKGITVDGHEVERELRKNAAGYPPGLFPRVLHAEQLTFEQYQDRLMRKATVERFLREHFSQLPEASDDEVRAHYEKTLGSEPRPARVRARQILLKTEEEAQHLVDELRKDRLTFEDAARRFSEAPEKDEGGDLGWFDSGAMPPVFEACFELEEGKVSDVVSSEFGFHVFLVLEKKEGAPETLEEARPRVQAELLRRQQELAYEELVAKLRAAAKVSISERSFRAALAQLPTGPFEEERGPDAAPPTLPEQDEAGGSPKSSPRAKPLPENR